MKIIICKTHEIKTEYWGGIIDGFVKNFGINKDVKAFSEYYQRTILGYSYHSIALNDEEIVIGYNSLLPTVYRNKKGLDILVGVSGGTFVVNEFRKDIFILYDMSLALLEYTSKENMIATIGVSNENSFQYALKFLDATLISFLNYYALPVRVFNALKIRKIASLNFISVLAVKLIIWINILLTKAFNGFEKEVQFELKTDESFFNNRFSSSRYLKIKQNNVTAYYSVVSEEGIRTVYLLDFRQGEKRTFKSLVTSVKYLIENEKPDLILFIGHLRLKQFLLFRVPRRFEPQKLPLTFNITSEKFISYFQSMSDDNNWNFGLMNFDAR